MGIVVGDVLPDVEIMEPENVAVSSTGEGIKNEEAASVSGSDLGLGVEIVSRKEKEIIAVNLGAGKGRKSSARRSNSSPAKRKVKVIKHTLFLFDSLSLVY